MMKPFFFLMLLANVIFFLWQYKTGALNPEINQRQLAEQEEKQIWLLSELKAKKAIDSANIESLKTERVVLKTQIAELESVFNTLKTKVIPPPENKESISNPVEKVLPEIIAKKQSVENQAETLCYQAQSFNDAESIEKWAEELALNKAFLTIEESRKGIVSAWIVYYPAEETFLASKNNLKMLKGKGVLDMWLFLKGKKKGEISLGLFKQQTGATKAKKELLGKGVIAEIRPRYRVLPKYSVKFQTEKTKQQLTASLKKIRPRPRLKVLAECQRGDEKS